MLVLTHGSKAAFKEAITQILCRSTHIVELIGVDMKKGIRLVSALQEYGRIDSFLQKHPSMHRHQLVRGVEIGRWHSTSRKRKQMVDTTIGLVHVHGLGFTHGDLKPV
jgi:hypothetical protein